MREAPPPRAMEAQPGRQEQRRPRRDDGLADSVRRIERSTRGRVINAERVQSDGRSINRIKAMDDRDRKRTRLNSSHYCASRIPSSAWKTKTPPTATTHI